MIKLCLIEKMFLRNSALLIRRISSRKTSSMCTSKWGAVKSGCLLCFWPFYYFSANASSPYEGGCGACCWRVVFFLRCRCGTKVDTAHLVDDRFYELLCIKRTIIQRGTKRKRGNEKYYIEIAKKWKNNTIKTLRM